MIKKTRNLCTEPFRFFFCSRYVVSYGIGGGDDAWSRRTDVPRSGGTCGHTLRTGEAQVCVPCGLRHGPAELPCGMQCRARRPEPDPLPPDMPALPHRPHLHRRRQSTHERKCPHPCLMLRETTNSVLRSSKECPDCANNTIRPASLISQMFLFPVKIDLKLRGSFK